MRFVAGQGADAELFLAVGAVAKRHREDVAGRGAAAKSHREAGEERAPAAGRERAPRAASEQKREQQNPLS